MSDHDEFDEIFRDFRRFVDPAPGQDGIDDSALADLPQLEGMDIDVEDEVIRGTHEVTYLLYAGRMALEDFSVSVHEEEVEVRTRGFTTRRPLGASVDPDDARTSYRNGVYSVKVRRRTPCEGKGAP